MTDHAQEVRWLLTDARQLCGALGWLDKAKPNGSGLVIRCPNHQDSEPSCGVTKGEDGTLRAKCFACGWTADALGMIALANGLDVTNGDDFREILATGAQIGGDLRLADEISNGSRFEGCAPRKSVEAPPPEPPREYPPIAEVGQLWAMAIAVGMDPDASDYLRGRQINPDSVDRLGLARVIPYAQKIRQKANTEGLSTLRNNNDGTREQVVLPEFVPKSALQQRDIQNESSKCSSSNGNNGSDRGTKGVDFSDGGRLECIPSNVTQLSMRSGGNEGRLLCAGGGQNGKNERIDRPVAVPQVRPRRVPPVSGDLPRVGLFAPRDADVAPGGAFSGGLTIPTWAVCKGGPWSSAGYRLIVRAWDAGGKLRSVRSWQVEGGDGPKRLPPSGHKQAGLVQANARAVKMLLGQAPAGRVLVCEGEPDWMTWATRVPADVAVFGIGSGAWTPEHAAKIPKGSEVLVLTHRDPAGHKYAKDVTDTLGDNVQVWRLDGEEGCDENDRAKNGKLPEDPRDGCVPWNDAARKVAEEEPRFYTVKQLLQDAHKRLVSQEPVRMWTSGHWKVDLMTGGFRPDTCWVIGAASSWGKSSIAISIADENIRNWHTKAKVMIVSCEDSEELYADRLLARRARVNALRLRDKRLKPDEHQRVAEVLAQAEDVPVYLDGRGVTFERLIHQIDRMIVEHDIDITILDYIQECRTKTKHEDDRRMFREIAKLFRHTVKRRKKSGAIMTQLTIPDPGKPPTKDNIRECKDIGHGAEVIALGWEPVNQIVAGKDTFEAGAKLLLLDKTKSGRKGTVELSWDGVSACFNRSARPVSEEDEAWYDEEPDITDAIGAIDYNNPYV